MVENDLNKAAEAALGIAKGQVEQTSNAIGATVLLLVMFLWQSRSFLVWGFAGNLSNNLYIHTRKIRCYRNAR